MHIFKCLSLLLPLWCPSSWGTEADFLTDEANPMKLQPWRVLWVHGTRIELLQGKLHPSSPALEYDDRDLSLKHFPLPAAAPAPDSGTVQHGQGKSAFLIQERRLGWDLGDQGLIWWKTEVRYTFHLPLKWTAFISNKSLLTRSEPDCFWLVSYLKKTILMHMLPNAILMQMLCVAGDILDLLMH